MELLGIPFDNEKFDDTDSHEDYLQERLDDLKKYTDQFGKDHQQAIDNYLKLNDNRGGIAIEIIRSFARAAHVLTEHLDAYANEGFLGTATQWENVRRLVYGLDYHPNPPASATTYLTLHAKPEQGGLVARGLQIKHSPENGSPVVFETLEDIEVDPAFNALRLQNWNHSYKKISDAKTLELNRIIDDLRRGEPVIVESSRGNFQPHLVEDFSNDSGYTELTLNPPVSGTCGDLIIHLNPAEELETFAILSQGKVEVNIVKRIARDDLCVAVCGSNLAAARVQAISEIAARIEKQQNSTEEKAYPARSNLQVVKSWQFSSGSVIANFPAHETIVFGKFKEQARLKDWNFNEDRKEKLTNKLVLEDIEVARKLKDRLIVIEEEESEPRKNFQTTVQNVNENPNGSVTVTLEPPFPEGYTIGRTVIYANVVPAGHGETQPERILGSGNATLSNQEFLFPVTDVSFVPDQAQVSGVRADIEVRVDGVPWTQVSRFNLSRSADLHYVVRMTEERHLRIVFGDGVNGRRLPSGENNVRIAWRMGSGSAGKLKAGSLTKLALPHSRIEAIGQPSDSRGGSDMESVTSLRRSAPASLMTMERAVSVGDFAALAASHNRVWNAHAELQSYGSERVVRVTVVPAYGDPLDSDLKKDLKEYLLFRAIPGIHVELEPFRREILRLKINIGIDTNRFKEEDIKKDVRQTLLQRFTLEKRPIGAPVYLSDVYQCVEAIRGIEYSVCKFIEINDKGKAKFEDGEVKTTNEQSWSPNTDGVLYIPDPNEMHQMQEDENNIINLTAVEEAQK
ncbi:MAG: hypothetical protein FWF12_03925 [Betaproteobacteria bacterium]|nr:hypothetical protein [Betaproteobacteria bacterium]